MTGYWVSEVTEKWRFRMIVPDKGDYMQVPLNPAGRKVANAWDPAKDEARGEACRSYGAAALLQVPGPAAHHLAGRQPRFGSIRIPVRRRACFVSPSTRSGRPERVEGRRARAFEWGADVAGTFGRHVGRRRTEGPPRRTGRTRNRR